MFFLPHRPVPPYAYPPRTLICPSPHVHTLFIPTLYLRMHTQNCFGQPDQFRSTRFTVGMPSQPLLVHFTCSPNITMIACAAFDNDLAHAKCSSERTHEQRRSEGLAHLPLTPLLVDEAVLVPEASNTSLGGRAPETRAGSGTRQGNASERRSGSIIQTPTSEQLLITVSYLGRGYHSIV